MNENAPTHSIGEAARILGVSVDTLRRWDESGKLPARRVGIRGDRRYTDDDINRALGKSAA